MKQLFNRKWLILIIGLIVIITAIIYCLLKQQEKKEDAMAISFVDDRIVSFLDEAYVSDFIKEIKGTLIEDSRIDTTSIGEKEVIVKYTNYKNKKKQTKYTIKVIDDEAPKILMGNSYTVKVGYDKKLTDVILSGDDCDDNPTRKIEGEYNLNEIGEYPLTFVITDSSGNERRKDFTLKVVEDNKKSGSDSEEKKQFGDIIKTYKTENNKIGIDVSKWQEEIDWKKVKDSGVEFAMIRIGYQDGIKGENVIDPYFYQNIKTAKEVGLSVGVYFYSYASTKEESEEQAEWIIQQLQNYSLELPIAFDWENWTSFPKFEISFYKLNDIANTFMQKIKSKGYDTSLYSSKTYLEKIWENTEYKTWLAHYTDETNYTGKYHMWQMCETGIVDGINTDVDINILYE